MKNWLYSGVALAVLAGAAVPAWAQQQSGASVELETINVEGAGQGTAQGEGGPTVATKEETVLTTRVTREQLDQEQVSDFRDLSRLTPGVSFSNSTGSFNIRGLDRSRVMTTIDGIRVPWIEDGARGVQGGVASFDLDMLSEIDLIKGSDSTVFGSGALGGVVALRTLEPEDLIEPGKNFGGLTRSRFDSRDESWGADQALAARVDNTFLLVQGGYRKGHEMDNRGSNDIYDVTRTTPNPQDYDQQSVLVKLKQHVDGNHIFGITGEHFERDEDNDDRTADPATYTLGSVKREEVTKRDRISANYSYAGDGFVNAADAVVYWQRQIIEDNFSANRITTPTGPYIRNNDREQETYGITGSLMKEIETGSLFHKVSFGGELFGSTASSYSEGQDNCGPGPFPPFGSCNFLHTNQADMPEVDGLTFGAFLQDEIALFDGRVRVTPGIRYDWYEEKPQDTPEYQDNPNWTGTLPPDSSDDHISGKLRIEGDPSENVTLYAQWAQAFRAPTANELYLDYGGPGTYLRVGNPDLKPETSNGFDIGAKVGDKNLGGSVSAFYNRYKNFIDDQPRPGFNPSYPLGITDTINRANVEIYGLEITAHYRDTSGWHGWTKFGAYSGEDIDLNEGLNTIPATKVVLGIGYATDFWGLDGIVTAAAARDADDVENANSETPSYATLDFTGWWSPQQVKGLTFRAGIYNITDEKYFEDALDLASTVQNKDYYTEPGRNVRVSATYKF